MLLGERAEEVQDVLVVFQAFLLSMREGKHDGGGRLTPSNNPVSGRFDRLRDVDITGGDGEVSEIFADLGLMLC